MSSEQKEILQPTESELLKAFTASEGTRLVWQVERERYLKHARIVINAILKKNGGNNV